MIISIYTKALTKKSNLNGNFRELMVGENQCGSLSEWTLELQTETILIEVGFGEQSHRYKRQIL